MNPLMQIFDPGGPPSNKALGQCNDIIAAGTGEKPAEVFEEILGETLVDSVPVSFSRFPVSGFNDPAELNQETPANIGVDVKELLNIRSDFIDETKLPDDMMVRVPNLISSQLEKATLSKYAVAPLVQDDVGQNIPNDYNLATNNQAPSDRAIVNRIINTATAIPDLLNESNHNILTAGPEKAINTPVTVLRTELPADYHQSGDDSILPAEQFKELKIKEVNIARASDVSVNDKGNSNIKPVPVIANGQAAVSDSKENSLSRDTGQFGDNRNAANLDPNRQLPATRADGKSDINGFENILKSESTANNTADKINNNNGILSRLTPDSSPTTANSPIHSEATIAKEDTPQIRFIFPTEPENSAVRNGHTVTIKMEPEHLGTVRMTVTSIHDTITARLVVESGTAKTALESNLNNLVEHLDRQGIKVDVFQVSVSGGQVGEELAKHKFPESWRQTFKSSRIIGKFKAIPEVLENVSRDRQYISATGVNCLA